METCDLLAMVATRDHHAGLLHEKRFGGRPTPHRAQNPKTKGRHAGLLHGERFGGRPTPRRGRGYPPQDAHEGRAPVLRHAWTPHSHLLQAPR